MPIYHKAIIRRYNEYYYSTNYSYSVGKSQESFETYVNYTILSVVLLSMRSQGKNDFEKTFEVREYCKQNEEKEF